MNVVYPWIALVALDVANLGIVNRAYYASLFPDGIQSWPALAVFYAMYPALVGVIVVRSRPQSDVDAALLGGLLGLLVYGTYHLTNKATLPRPWPWSFVVFDTAWGVLVTSLVAWLWFRAFDLTRHNAEPSPLGRGTQ